MTRISYSKFSDKKFRESLPRPSDFSKAIFILDIGQNDIAAALKKSSFHHQKASVPKIARLFTKQVQVSNAVT